MANLWITILSSFFTLLLLLLSPILLTIFRAYLKHLSLKHIPGPPQHWFLGNLRLFLKKPVHKVHLSLVKGYGTIYQIRFNLYQVVYVAHAQTIHQVLKSGAKYLPKAVDSFAYMMLSKITKAGLPNILTSPENEYWRVVRRTLAPAFSSANIRIAHKDVAAATQRVIDHLTAVGPEATVNMDEWAQRLTVDVIGYFMFNQNLHATEGGEKCAILPLIKRLLQTMQAVLRTPFATYRPWVKPMREFRKVVAQVDAEVEQQVRAMQKDPPPPNTLMAHLLTIVDPTTRQPLSINQLKSETMLLWIAGFETTAHSIAFALTLISEHPEVESRLLAELDQAGLLPSPSNPEPQLVWEDLASLTYLNACIFESLRMFPVAPSTFRKTPRDMEINGTMVPKNTLVAFNFYAVQRYDAHWPDASKFKPERWLDDPRIVGDNASSLTGECDDGVSKKHYGWLPFSEGPRNCLGMTLAMVELRTALAMLLSRFKFNLIEEMGGLAGVEKDTKVEITMRAVSGILMNATPRVALR